MYKQVSDDLYIRDLPWVNVYFSLQHLSLDGTAGSLVKWQFRGRYDSTDNADIDKFSRNVSTIDDGSAFDEPVSDHSAIHKSTSDLANYVYDPCNIDSNSIQFYGSCDDNPCRYSDSFGNHFCESCDNSSSGHNYTNKWKLSS
ncbi:hypothetical protein JG688_00005433 [Phytophthora aleatoria]|uniref:Uncharacterized protein n=1 Tax=Phytophthora aleatoria TaxID=2496075 RepID=A0A8J5J8G8_9STRA|nr:hypothetical protein JG688_00005433 [Phytophthora aleatoria]